MVEGRAMSEYNLYWGEAHDNTYQFASMPVGIEEVYNRAASHLDFYHKHVNTARYRWRVLEMTSVDVGFDCSFSGRIS